MNIEQVRSQVNNIIAATQEELAAMARRTELRQQFATYLGDISSDTGNLYRRVIDRCLEVRDERPGGYTELALEDTQTLESNAPEVIAAIGAFTKGVEEDRKDIIPFDDSSGHFEGPLEDLLNAIVHLKDCAKKASTFVAAQTLVTPGSHAANAVQYMQEGAAHLTDYRDSKL